jgi:hypothetical protein
MQRMPRIYKEVQTIDNNNIVFLYNRNTSLTVEDYLEDSSYNNNKDTNL